MKTEFLLLDEKRLVNPAHIVSAEMHGSVLSLVMSDGPNVRIEGSQTIRVWQMLSESWLKRRIWSLMLTDLAKFLLAGGEWTDQLARDKADMLLVVSRWIVGERENPPAAREMQKISE